MSLPFPPPRASPALEGSVFSQVWSGWFRNVWQVLNPGVSVNVALAKITPGGANGSITIVKGVVTAYVAPT